MARSDKPLVGVTLDAEESGGYSAYPWYALRRNYTDALLAAGALPVALPHHAAVAADIVERLDALVVTGGAFDVDPALYGSAERHASVVLKADRTAAELAFLRWAMARDMPILGICGGEQLLGVALGARLIQHIPDEVVTTLEHEQTTPRHLAGHSATITRGSRLHRATGRARMQVNSSHHQAVRGPCPGMTVSARAPDGVVEAIEAPGLRFCIGVQWHPEFLIDPGDAALFAALVEAARA